MKTDPTKINIVFDPTVQRMRGVAHHGNTPFDVPFVSAITDDLWQGGCETGLVLPRNVSHLLSLYPWEKYMVHHQLSSELYFRMYDSLDQAMDQVNELATYINNRRKTGVTLVHCQAGLNRSSLIATRALMLGGMSAVDAISLVRSKRSPACLCNPQFENYLMSL